MNLSEQIQSVNEKLQQLLKQHQALQRENQRLVKENVQPKDKFETKARQNFELQQRIETLKIVSNELNDDVKKDLEKRINNYLKEIDKCLTLFNG